MKRLFLISIFIMAPVFGQDWPTPTAPPAPAPPEAPEPRWVHGELRVVIPHTFEIKSQTVLVLENMRGDLVIEGSNSKVIVIKERIDLRRYQDLDRAREAVNDLSGKLEVDPKRTDVVYFVAGKWGGRRINYDYTIQIPHSFNIVADTYTGDIDLSNVQGDLELTSGAGDISLSDANGKIKVKSGGGDIDLFKVEGQVRVHTGGGDIEARLSEGSYIVEVGGGDIEFWNSKGNFEISTGGGDIEIHRLAGERLKLKTGGGDIHLTDIKATVNIMTGGGDIEMQDITGDVEAATGGGDIELNNLDGNLIGYSAAGDFDIVGITGYVRARTNYGDITVVGMLMSNLGQRDSDISTQSGDIYLEYSGGKDISIEALLRGYKPHYGVERIESNIEFDFLNEGGNTRARWVGDSLSHTINLDCAGGTMEIIRRDN